MGQSSFDIHTAQIFTLVVNDASGSAPIGFLQDSANAQRVDKLIITTDDTVDHTVLVVLPNYFGGDPMYLASINLPAGAGFDPTVPPLELMSAIAAFAGGLVIPVNQPFGVAVPVALSAGKKLYVTTFGGTF